MSPPDDTAITRLNAALEGRYRIESELGEGGMANVYLADDLKHERKVALKVLKPELAAVVGAERFLAEIKTTANLSHPHILPLFDSGEADGFLFYVMPHVEGESLRDRLDREHQLPVEDAVRVATNLAEALDYAHRKGVIHRDIKPANVLLLDGKPVISDFGIALAVGTAGQGRLTETGLSLGTPHYMSPEQATGDMSVGPATDIYALGAVLYEMLVGEPPYTGSTAQAILGKIIAGKLASATGERASVPGNVDATIRKALEKIPADRFTDAREFGKALTDSGFRHEETAAAGSAAGAGPWNRLTMITTATTALFALAFGWALLRPAPPAPVTRLEIVLGEGQNLVQRNSGTVALSRDGTRIVYVGAAPGGGWQLWQRWLDDLEPVPIPGTENHVSPAISPDGLSVAFSAPPGNMKTVSFGGGPVFTVVPSGIANSGKDWGSDGMLYYQRVGGGIERVPATGGEPETVTEDPAHGWPDVLPDGRGLLVTVTATDPEERRIAVVGPEGGEARDLFAGTMARYATSGHVVYTTAAGTLMAAPFDLKRLEVTGPSVALVEGVAASRSGTSQFALSETGTLFYETDAGGGTEFEFVWVTRSGEATPVDAGETFEPASNNRSWRLSPDGSRIAFARNVDGNTDIWIKTLPDGAVSRLTFHEDQDLQPQWTPDGRSITYSNGIFSGEGFLWSIRADGTGEPELVFDGFNSPKGVWSPDGEWLVLRRSGEVGTEQQTARDIMAIRPGVDSVAIPLVETPEFSEQAPAISRDGRWLAYSSNETGRQEVFVRPFPDVSAGKWRVSTDGGILPVWAHNGRELFFADPGTRELKVREFTATSTTFQLLRLTTLFEMPEELFFTASGVTDFYDIGLDDARFLMARQYGLAPAAPSLIVVQNFFEDLKRLVPN